MQAQGKNTHTQKKDIRGYGPRFRKTCIYFGRYLIDGFNKVLQLLNSFIVFDFVPFH